MAEAPAPAPSAEDELATKILRQVEYYFSDDSYPFDEYIRSQEKDGMISASRGAAAPSRHRRASSPGEEVAGGFSFDIEAVRTAHDVVAVTASTRYRAAATPSTWSRESPRAS